MNKTIGYIRVSTEEQADSGLGLEAQRAAIRKFLDREPDAWFSDEGIHGDVIDRPGLIAAIAELKRGDTLVVAKRDRLARSVFISCWLEKEAKRDKWHIISAAGEGTDSDTPEALLMRRIVDVFAEYERLVIGYRTKRALEVKKARANGAQVNGGARFGWRWVGEPKHMKLVEVPEEQAIIREIINMNFLGISFNAIAGALGLSERKVKTIYRQNSEGVKNAKTT